MACKVYNLEYYRLKKQNDNTAAFIGEAIANDDFVELNVHLIKQCLISWAETNSRLSNWD